MLPASFKKYTTVNRPTRKRMMILLQGLPNTGKTEFIMSAPGPGINMCMDMGYEGVELNPNPPAWRNNEIVNFPWPLLPNMAIGTNVTQTTFTDSWINFRDAYFETAENADSLTSGLDGGTEQWEALRMALWGRIEQIPELNYTAAYSLLKAFVWRQFKTNKNVLQTFKLKEEWVDQYDNAGEVIKDDRGRAKRKISGQMLRDGPHGKFDEWYWQVQLITKHRDAEVIPASTRKMPFGPDKGKIITTPEKIVPGQFGIEIVHCKFNPDLKGTELWGDDCNFWGLAKTIFPDTTREEWGYKS